MLKEINSIKNQAKKEIGKRSLETRESFLKKHY